MTAAETALADQRTAVLVALAACCVPALADDDEETVTDMEFLEYLGSWEESDEEWELLDGVIMAQREDAPVEEAEEDPPEKEDES